MNFGFFLIGLLKWEKLITSLRVKMASPLHVTLESIPGNPQYKLVHARYGSRLSDIREVVELKYCQTGYSTPELNYDHMCRFYGFADSCKCKSKRHFKTPSRTGVNFKTLPYMVKEDLERIPSWFSSIEHLTYVIHAHFAGPVDVTTSSKLFEQLRDSIDSSSVRSASCEFIIVITSSTGPYVYVHNDLYPRRPARVATYPSLMDIERASMIFTNGMVSGDPAEIELPENYVVIQQYNPSNVPHAIYDGNLYITNTVASWSAYFLVVPKDHSKRPSLEKIPTDINLTTWTVEMEFYIATLLRIYGSEIDNLNSTKEKSEHAMAMFALGKLSDLRDEVTGATAAYTFFEENVLTPLRKTMEDKLSALTNLSKLRDQLREAACKVDGLSKRPGSMLASFLTNIAPGSTDVRRTTYPSQVYRQISAAGLPPHAGGPLALGYPEDLSDGE